MSNLTLPDPTPSAGQGKTHRPQCQKQGSPDDFQTPASALTPLLPYLPHEWRIWEPACGKGNLVRGLERHGYFVTGTDIRQGTDFLLCQPPAGWDAQVTNPPYSVKNRWLAHSYALGKPFALLLPYAALESQERQEMFRRYGVQCLLLDKRVHFETPTGKASSAWFAVMWLTWGLGLPADLMFAATGEDAQGVLL